MFSINEKVDEVRDEQWNFWEKIAKSYRAKNTIKGAFIKYIIMDWLYDIAESVDETVMNEQMGGEKEYLDYLRSSMVNKKEIIRQIEAMYDKDAKGVKESLEEINGDDLDYINDFSHEYYYANGISVPELNTVA